MNEENKDCDLDDIRYDKEERLQEQIEVHNHPSEGFEVW